MVFYLYTCIFIQVAARGAAAQWALSTMDVSRTRLLFCMSTSACVAIRGVMVWFTIHQTDPDHWVTPTHRSLWFIVRSFAHEAWKLWRCASWMPRIRDRIWSPHSLPAACSLQQLSGLPANPPSLFSFSFCLGFGSVQLQYYYKNSSRVSKYLLVLLPLTVCQLKKYCGRATDWELRERERGICSLRHRTSWCEVQPIYTWVVSLAVHLIYQLPSLPACEL